MKSKLKGHQKRITGLAFSNALNVLVSSGADAQVASCLVVQNCLDFSCVGVLVCTGLIHVAVQLCVWGTDGWEKRKSKFLQSPASRASSPIGGETRVQFHNDQIRLLVVHESQLAVFDAGKLERVRCVRSPNFLHLQSTCAHMLTACCMAVDAPRYFPLEYHKCHVLM